MIFGLVSACRFIEVCLKFHDQTNKRLSHLSKYIRPESKCTTAHHEHSQMSKKLRLTDLRDGNQIRIFVNAGFLYFTVQEVPNSCQNVVC